VSFPFEKNLRAPLTIEAAAKSMNQRTGQFIFNVIWSLEIDLNDLFNMTDEQLHKAMRDYLKRGS
jgi:hypothetical protein